MLCSIYHLGPQSQLIPAKCVLPPVSGQTLKMTFLVNKTIRFVKIDILFSDNNLAPVFPYNI